MTRVLVLARPQMTHVYLCVHRYLVEFEGNKGPDMKGFVGTGDEGGVAQVVCEILPEVARWYEVYVYYLRGAVWCSVVQCGAVWCSVVQCGAV